MSHGGSYADNAVAERRDMGMFFLVILCLTPVSFATTLPVVSRPDVYETPISSPSYQF